MNFNNLFNSIIDLTVLRKVTEALLYIFAIKLESNKIITSMNKLSQIQLREHGNLNLQCLFLRELNTANLII